MKMATIQYNVILIKNSNLNIIKNNFVLSQSKTAVSKSRISIHDQHSIYRIPSISINSSANELAYKMNYIDKYLYNVLFFKEKILMKSIAYG